jgi:hypothetical protein
MRNNIQPHSSRNVFQHQSPSSNLQRPPGGVWQDKGAEKSGRGASRQPAPIENKSRARLSDTKLFRSNKLDSTKVKLRHTTIHLHPIDKAELQRIAQEEQLSVSSVGATAVHEWLQWELHKQQEALMYPIIRQLLRDELQAFGNRIVFFLMRIAIASEQARILITEVLKRLLFLIQQFAKLIIWLTNDKKQESQYKFDSTQSPIETFNTIVEKSYKMARANVFRKSNEMKKMLEEWEAWGEGKK